SSSPVGLTVSSHWKQLRTWTLGRIWFIRFQRQKAAKSCRNANGGGKKNERWLRSPTTNWRLRATARVAPFHTNNICGTRMAKQEVQNRSQLLTASTHSRARLIYRSCLARRSSSFLSLSLS